MRDFRLAGRGSVRGATGEILGCGGPPQRFIWRNKVTYVIAQPCVDLKDRACVDECPVDCIYEGKRMLYIHPDECVDCGACEPVCPVEAIFYEDDTPEQWKDYYTANVDFFDDLGSPGGAAKLGVIDKDHALIAALPPAEPGMTRSHETAPSTSPWWAARSVSRALPDFPWDHLTTYGARAREHRDGIVDLSIGTPVDPTPELVQRALAEAADSPGYPLTIGRVDTRQAAVDWLARRFGVTGLTPRRGAPGDRLQGADRLDAQPSRARCRGRRGGAGAGLPDLRGGRPARGCALRRDRLADQSSARSGCRSSGSTRPPTRPAGCCPSTTSARSWPGAASGVPCWSPTSATWRWPGRARRRCPCSTRTCAGATTPGSSRSTRSPSAPTWRATAARSWPATPPWSGSCSQSARTSACRCPGPQQHAMRAALEDDAHVEEQHARYARRRVRPEGGARAAQGSGSTRPRVARTSGPPATSPAGTRSAGWPTGASWSRPASSTARRAPSTCGSRSPRPTSGSRPPYDVSRSS